MTYKFLTQPLKQGRYEPEGIYLSHPLRDKSYVVQPWGDNEQHYGTYSYNGVQLKGHNGVDFGVERPTGVLAVDDGRVMEIGLEQGGYNKYIKVEHAWGESFYAHLDAIVVDAGQLVKRNLQLAQTALTTGSTLVGPFAYLHFAIRTRPYNRFDGWGGFVDPIPYLDPTDIHFDASPLVPDTVTHLEPHPMLRENERSRRP